MPGQRGQAQRDDQNVMDDFVVKTASATLTILEQVVECDSTAGIMTITLPPVSEAKGKIFSIYLDTDGGDITIQDQDDSRGWDGDYTLDDVGDAYALYSNGRSWYPIGALA